MESLRQIVYWKRKYHAKTQDLSNFWVLRDRADQIYSLFLSDASTLVNTFNNFAFSLCFIFGLDPIEVEPINFDFDVQLPTWEELLQGIYVILQRIDVTTLYQRFQLELYNRPMPPGWTFNWAEMIKEFAGEFAGPTAIADMTKYGTRKAIYGQSPYGTSYYDPMLVRAYITSTLTKNYVRFWTDISRQRFEEALMTLEALHPEIRKYIEEKMRILQTALTETFILGYGVLNISKLTPKTGEYANLAGELLFKTLAELLFGFILNITPLGYGYLLPKDLTPVIEYCHKITPKFSKFIWYRIMRMVERLRIAAQAILNYTTVEEMRDYTKSWKTEYYGHKMAVREVLRQLVLNIVRRYGVDGYTANMYFTAVLNLVFGKSIRHAWGIRVQQYASWDEWKRLWLEYWKRQGLNEEILKQLLGAVETCLPYLRRLLAKSPTYRYQARLLRKYHK